MDVDVVSFRLPGHGDTALSNMNFLRTQQHFCDVTIVAGGRRMFRGHKVVLAACSAFLRDQFLLNPSSELQVSMLHSSAVVCELLQSCYTGMLQFSAKEIVNYLTAASYLQMEHVVEKCRGALSQYMQPRSCSPVVNVSTSNKSIQTVKSEDYPSMPVIISVRGSDASGHFEGEDGPESDVFQVQINDEHQDPEKTSGAEEEDREAVVVLDDHGQLDAGIEEPYMEGRPKGNGIGGAGRMWRRRHGAHRGGRGRGFKHRKRYTFKDRKLLGNYQDYQEHLLTLDETMGNFGADFQANQNLTDGSVFVEYRPGERQGEEIGSDGGPAHFSVEASSGEEGMGVGTHTNEHGAADESVAVVGSTSCVAGPVVCEQCGLAFSSTQDLAMHSLSTHRLYVYPCCGKHFSHFNIFNRHMIVHCGVSKHHCCPLCHKTFTQKSTLCDHMNVHSGERPYVCAYCHVSFAHKSALRSHLMEQHGKTMPQNHMEMQRNNEGGVWLGFKSYLNR
ncbi:LOW QUALITY PROTEIN: zinc finger and BTB domain-containing protein 6-like [Sinocyclocheilus anshuiensis]|uniref:LOW QUALITY PROTEIN: zinc finger and BTB domain-containing protein 6-like n=1 Tax=Sinocyclocheilus anshuiensis TaxID=1608454 RepID=UPI0007B7C2BD|nr:PREDICTED: LOW QUALITY PROTEIN: zinc finger and BTB domain-containing protein 6-like [Sinocyclocheilus anshuiensis]